MFNVSFLVVPTTFRTALSMPLQGGHLRACACKKYIFRAHYYGFISSVKQHNVNSVSFITLSLTLELKPFSDAPKHTLK